MKNLLFFLQIIIPSLVFAQINGYESQNIQGFDVYVQLEALNNHPQETNDALNLLNSKLLEITDFGLKENITGELKLVKIFVDWNTTNGAAVYHPNLQWLIDNGYIIEKWKSIEISNINNFINWTELNQPFMVMHEFSHAYHDRVLGFSYPQILQAFNAAMQNHLYDSVLYYAGNGVYYYKEAYATTDHKEYFAEISEAYLGKNDFYPFIRAELEMHDPIGYNIVSSIWKFEGTMSVEKNIYKNITLYPNPTNGIITIQWNKIWRPELIEISTLDGKILMKNHPEAIGNTTLDISNLASGIYFLVLDNHKTYKIIKSE